MNPQPHGRTKSDAAKFRKDGVRKYTKVKDRNPVEMPTVRLSGAQYQCPDCWAYYPVDAEHVCPLKSKIS